MVSAMGSSLEQLSAEEIAALIREGRSGARADARSTKLALLQQITRQIAYEELREELGAERIAEAIVLIAKLMGEMEKEKGRAVSFAAAAHEWCQRRHGEGNCRMPERAGTQRK